MGAEKFIYNSNYRLEQQPLLLEWAQIFWGKALLLLLFSYALWVINQWWSIPYWPKLSLILIMLSYFPAWRKMILFVAMLFLLNQNAWFNIHHLPMVAAKKFHLNVEVISIYVWWYAAVAALAVSVCFLALMKYFRARNPVLLWGVSFFILILLGLYAPFPHQLKLGCWIFIAVLANYFWFVAYTLKGVHQRALPSLLQDMRYYIPFWGSSFTPIPKGADYLDKIAAKNAQELAICQIKALKLIAWVIILLVFYKLILLFQQQEKIPSLRHAFGDYQAGKVYTAKYAWLCLCMQFLRDMLELTIWGHIIIAIARMSGFHALRNTFKPLYARSIAEFWNRYYFYYKELLVEFFFYPNYFRFFKKQPKLRMLFATFMAAGVGNVIFHFFYYLEYPVQLGLFEAVKQLQAFIFYCVILSLMIGISQIYPKQKITWHRLFRFILTPLWVDGFFLMSTVFNEPYATKNIMINFAFFRSLF